MAAIVATVAMILTGMMGVASMRLPHGGVLN